MHTNKNFMMKWITTFCMICISLLEGYSESIQTADSLRQNQEYDLARLTYERIIYSSADNVSRTEALLGKAQCYLDENDFDGAQYTVERIVFFGAIPGILVLLLYTIATLGLLLFIVGAVVLVIGMAELFFLASISICSVF